MPGTKRSVGVIGNLFCCHAHAPSDPKSERHQRGQYPVHRLATVDEAMAIVPEASQNAAGTIFELSEGSRVLPWKSRQSGRAGKLNSVGSSPAQSRSAGSG